MKAMLEATQRARLACYHVEDIGLHYATTLKLWHEAWLAQEAAIKALGHDDAFFRKWRFYFSYCEAGFAQQFIHCYQIVWTKAPVALARWDQGGSSSSVASGVRLDTSAIFLAWCFLSGLATGKFLSALWMVPLFGVAFLVLAALARAVAPMLRFVRLLDTAGTAMWTSSLVSSVFSASTLALWLVCFASGSFADRSSSAPLDTHCQVAGPPAAALPHSRHVPLCVPAIVTMPLFRSNRAGSAGAAQPVERLLRLGPVQQAWRAPRRGRV
jgi:hypothetical protein